YAVAHLAFSGFCTYFLARRLRLPRLASFTAAAVWISGGPLLSLVSLWHHFAGAAWMPAVLLAAFLAAGRPGFRTALVWGGAAGGQLLAGSFDLCLLTHALTAAL